MILGTRQLAQFLRNIKKTVGKLTNNKAYGHYREMAWLPFQKIKNLNVTDFQKMFCRFAEFASGVLSEQVEPLIRKVLKTSHIPNVNFR